ncbi:MAG: transglutaminase-like domain-containing protein [Deltaproteobacteria bacterium]|nr:transglutaminase-like domain-containing protein [Deltaproteobacteria bacterium]
MSKRPRHESEILLREVRGPEEPIEVLDLTTRTEARHELVALMDGPKAAIDLAQACLLITRDELDGDLDEDEEAASLEELDHLATRVRHTFSPGASSPERLAALHQVLFDDAGFCGNHEDYYAIDNALLPRVMATGMGLPLLLCVVYVEVARRVGIEAQPVAFPGHFLVRCELDDGFLVIDPFNGGRLLDRADCEELLEEITEGQHTFDEAMLEPATELEVLTRLYLNLRRSHLLAGDIVRALRAQDGVVALNPDSIPALRDRARLYARLGAHPLAALDLEHCLELGPRTGKLYQALQQEAAMARRKGRFQA